ncbi:MAG: hypothetical protein D6732_14105, partial [Methanobacteriota archaeon]
TGGTSVAEGDTLKSKISDVTLTDAGKALFADLAKVSTVPGLGLAGDATKGIPGWLMEARADANKKFYVLTLLIRL